MLRRSSLMLVPLCMLAGGCGGGDDVGWLAIQTRGTSAGAAEIDAIQIIQDGTTYDAVDVTPGTDVENEDGAVGAPDGDCDDTETYLTMTGDQSRVTYSFDVTLLEGDTIEVLSLGCGGDNGTFSVHVAMTADLGADHERIDECTAGGDCSMTVPAFPEEEE